MTNWMDTRGVAEQGELKGGNEKIKESRHQRFKEGKGNPRAMKLRGKEVEARYASLLETPIGKAGLWKRKENKKENLVGKRDGLPSEHEEGSLTTKENKRTQRSWNHCDDPPERGSTPHNCPGVQLAYASSVS